MTTSGDFADWIGRSEARSDVATEAPVLALAAALDDGHAPPAAGAVLPPLWHWLYFLPRPLRSEIGPDGHAARGGFLPPVPLPRRMWAGGRLAWHAPDAIRVGDALDRVSRVADVSMKSGKSGDLVFVLVTHALSTPRGLAISEEHDIVYRDAPLPGAQAPTPPAAPTDEAWSGAHRAGRSPPVPLFGADLQRPSHPLRPAPT